VAVIVKQYLVVSDLFKIGFKLESPATCGTYACSQAWKVLGLRHVDESRHLTRWKAYEVKSAAATPKPESTACPQNTN